MARSTDREALNHAITAADLYMKAAHEAISPTDRSRLRRKCAGLISLAEKLKSSPKTASPSLAQPTVATITSTSNPSCHVRHVPSNERTILLRSSRLHGNIFPPWQAEPGVDNFSLSQGQKVFSYVCITAESVSQLIHKLETLQSTQCRPGKNPFLRPGNGPWTKRERIP